MTQEQYSKAKTIQEQIRSLVMHKQDLEMKININHTYYEDTVLIVENSRGPALQLSVHLLPLNVKAFFQSYLSEIDQKIESLKVEFENL